MSEVRELKTVMDWDYFLVYLSGPIDFAMDRGTGWRKEIISKLGEIGIKRSHIIDPCNKPLKGAQFDLDDESRIMRSYRVKKDWDGMEKIMSHIVHIDLRFVDLSSLVIANFPKVSQDRIADTIKQNNDALDSLKRLSVREKRTDCLQYIKELQTSFDSLKNEFLSQQVHTYGTIHEIVVARQQKKPVMIIWEGGKESCSGWLQWLVGHENVFDTMEDLVEQLSKISQGEAAYNANDWLLLQLEKV